MSETIVTQLTAARKLFAEASPNDPQVISDYGWTLVKAILHNLSDIDSLTARQLLADCINLPLVRPSKFHSALLTAAIKVSQTYPEFHFATFLKMWNLENLRPEDKAPQKTADGKSYPSLNERAAKTLAQSLLLHPEDRNLLQSSGLATLLSSYGLIILPMLVTRIKQATGKDGRKYTFVTLTSSEGIEKETISHTLHPSPLHPLPEGKRHYVNIGQLYDILLHQKSSLPPAPLPISASVPDASPSGPTTPAPLPISATVPDASPSGPAATVPKASALGQASLLASCLSPQRPADIFPTEIGYIEHIDNAHSHMHVYDSHSRHFVAPVQRFSHEKEGDLVRFIPIIPISSKFKTAIILTTVPSGSSEVQSILRTIRITSINQQKGYAVWELVNKDAPITELLSPLQLSQGETSPIFTTGYLSLTAFPAATLLNAPSASPAFPAPVPDASPSGPAATVPKASPSTSSTTVPDASASGLPTTLNALIYLKRGKDKQKRPFVAKLFTIQ